MRPLRCFATSSSVHDGASSCSCSCGTIVLAWTLLVVVTLILLPLTHLLNQNRNIVKDASSSGSGSGSMSVPFIRPKRSSVLPTGPDQLPLGDWICGDSLLACGPWINKLFPLR